MEEKCCEYCKCHFNGELINQDSPIRQKIWDGVEEKYGVKNVFIDDKII